MKNTYIVSFRKSFLNYCRNVVKADNKEAVKKNYSRYPYFSVSKCYDLDAEIEKGVEVVEL